LEQYLVDTCGHPDHDFWVTESGQEVGRLACLICATLQIVALPLHGSIHVERIEE
jgi:hypothetical protein